MMNAAVTHDSGVLTLSFQRARDTGDERDWAFADSDPGACYYFIYPLGGGPHSDTDFRKHVATPTISSDKICIGQSAAYSADVLRYDTIRDAVLACAQKPTRISLIYRTEPTTKCEKNRKTKNIINTDMLMSICKQSGESVESVRKKKR